MRISQEVLEVLNNGRVDGNLFYLPPNLFRNWILGNNGKTIKLSSGAFKESGTTINTRILKIKNLKYEQTFAK